VTWDIRKPEVDAKVSVVLHAPGRKALGAQQRRVGLRGRVHGQAGYWDSHFTGCRCEDLSGCASKELHAAIPERLREVNRQIWMKFYA
jgi:hypothetical protein